MIELEALFAAAEDEIDLRNKAILELSSALDVIYKKFKKFILIYNIYFF